MRESETIEFKKSLAELSEGLNSVAAILNKHGSGELWFGIKNDGKPAGMDVSETTLRKVSQAIAAHIEPKIYPDVSTVVIDGKSCIRVAFSGSEKPYYSHGRSYMRVADEDRQLSAKEIEAIILRKNRSHRGWDSEPITNRAFKPDATKIRAMRAKPGSLGLTRKVPSKASASTRTDITSMPRACFSQNLPSSLSAARCSPPSPPRLSSTNTTFPVTSSLSSRKRKIHSQEHPHRHETQWTRPCERS